MDILALFNTRKALPKLWNGCECHRAINHNIYVVFVWFNLDRDIGQATKAHQNRQNHTCDDSVEEVGKDNTEDGDDVDAEFPVLSKLTHMVDIDQIYTRVDQKSGEDRAWNQLYPRRCHEDKQGNPNAMENRRKVGFRTRLCICRGANDDACNGKAAKQTRDEVSESLTDEFPVEVGSPARMQLVDCNGA